METLAAVLLAPLGFLAVIVGEAIGVRVRRFSGLFGYSVAVVVTLALFFLPIRFLLDEPTMAKLGAILFIIGAIIGRWSVNRRVTLA